MSEIKCPNCGSEHVVYAIPDWEYDPEKGNYCVDPGFLECMKCHFNTGPLNTEDEIMAVINSFSRTAPASQPTAWTADEEFKERIGDCIQDALSSYRCKHTRDEDDDGFQLIDLLSPLETVKEGQEELIYLTDHIYNKLFLGPLSPGGE